MLEACWFTISVSHRCKLPNVCKPTRQRTGQGSRSCTAVWVLYSAPPVPGFLSFGKHERTRLLLVLKFHAHAQYTTNWRIYGLNIYECPDINWAWARSNSLKRQADPVSYCWGSWKINKNTLYSHRPYSMGFSNPLTIITIPMSKKLRVRSYVLDKNSQIRKEENWKSVD